MPQVMRSMLLRYGTSVLAVVLALLLTLLLKPLLEHGIFVLFLPAVMVGAWYGGLGSGLLATLLSVLSIDYFLLSPPGRLTPGWSDIPQLAIFVLIAVLINWLDEARHRAEERLRESEARYRVVAESAIDAVVSADSAGRIISWNRAAQHMFLFTEDEVLGRPLTMIMPGTLSTSSSARLGAISAHRHSAHHGESGGTAWTEKGWQRIPIRAVLIVLGNRTWRIVQWDHPRYHRAQAK